MTRFRVVLAAFVLVTRSAVPSTAAAQPYAAIDGATVAVNLGAAAAGHSWSGGGNGPFGSVCLDLPFGTARGRLSLGTVGWTPGNDPVRGGPTAGRIRQTHLAVTAIRAYVKPSLRYPVGIYAGAGAGIYRYRIQHGPPSAVGTWGLHAVGGIELRRFRDRFGLRMEVQVHVSGGAKHPQFWADTVPTVAAVAGISRRF